MAKYIDSKVSDTKNSINSFVHMPPDYQRCLNAESKALSHSMGTISSLVHYKEM